MKIISITISANASSIIGDAIRSVSEQVDQFVLVDTGITDDTIEKAREVAGSKLRVCKHAWKKDFSAARNAGLDYARELKADWAIIVDTDERIHWRGVDVRKFLAETPADVVLITSEDKTYIKEKIIRLSSDARFVGPAHEVPIRSGGSVTLPRATFAELDKSPVQLLEKRHRDISILTDWVAQKENAADGRWWYYLADTHEALGDHEKAATCFGKCVELRKPISEEGAYAAFRRAQCLLVLNRYQDAIDACAVGLTRYAGVAELAWIAALASYKMGHNHQASYWAYMAISIGRHAGCAPYREMFVHLPALYELPYDVLKFSLPTDALRKNAEAELVKAKRARLGASDERTIDVLSVTRCPERWELRPMLRPKALKRMIDGARFYDLSPSRSDLENAAVPNYHAMNPSVFTYNGGLHVVVRMVNYTIENGQYVSCDADGRIRTANLLGKLERDGSGYVLGELRAMRDLAGGDRFLSTVLGYEDVRPFMKGETLYASATVQDRNEGLCEIALLKIDKAGDIASAAVMSSDRTVEKNWMPITDNSTVDTWLYELSPPTVRLLNGLMCQRPPSTFSLEHLRGGSHVVPFDDGYLCVTHETISIDGWGGRRIYLHRFVKLDSNFEVVAVSPAWTFEDGSYGIEFCAGMTTDGDRMLISYGVEDREAKLMAIPQAEIRKLHWIERSDVDLEKVR